MAESRIFVCSDCGKIIESWSDGNPYYFDKKKKKHYAYHPDHKNLARCIGNDTPHLCLACAYEFNVDSLEPTTECPECKSGNIVDTYHLTGEKCPVCGRGEFLLDPSRYSIS